MSVLTFRHLLKLCHTLLKVILMEQACHRVKKIEFAKLKKNHNLHLKCETEATI